jgi:ATP-dependent DNA ligase
MLQPTLPAGFIAPCLPTKTDKLPSGSQWLHEIKHDGFRIIARKTGRQPLHAARGPFGDGKAIFNYFHEG